MDYYTAKPYDPCVMNVVTGGIQVTVCFHIDDLKLNGVLDYLKGTPRRGAILKAYLPVGVVTYVDASHSVHPDGKSCTGCVISLVTGPVFVRSTKQKSVSKSSTEAGLLVLSESISQIL